MKSFLTIQHQHNIQSHAGSFSTDLRFIWRMEKQRLPNIEQLNKPCSSSTRMHVINVKCNKKSIKKEKTSTTSRSFYVFFNLLLELTDSIRILRLFSAKLMMVEATLTPLIQVLARRNF